jgi:hypothetical protein
MKSSKKKYCAIAAVAIIALFVVGMTTGIIDNLFGQKSGLKPVFLDKDGNEIKSAGVLFTIVSTTSGQFLVSGATSMYFQLSVKNTGNYAWIGTIDTMTPNAMSVAFDKVTKTANKGETVTWTSNNISTVQFEGTIPTFYAKVKLTSSIDSSKTAYVEESLSYKFDPEETPSGSITFISSAGGGGGGFVNSSGTTLKTSGTSCTAGSECQSNSCVAQNQNVVTSCSGMTLCPVTAIGSCSVTSSGGTVGNTCTPDNYCSCGGSYTTFKYTSSTTISSCA